MQIYLFFHNEQTFFDYFVEVHYPANYFLNTK